MAGSTRGEHYRHWRLEMIGHDAPFSGIRGLIFALSLLLFAWVPYL